MPRYLFTDGISGVQEAYSTEELLSFINAAAEPGKTKVWIFGASEWISTADFFRRNPGIKRNESHPAADTNQPVPLKRKKAVSFLKRAVFVTALTGGAFLIYNFTDSGWQKAEPLSAYAARPGNMPVMNADSLQEEIEWQRGKALDKGTATNLRLRNNWPEQLLIKLDAGRETKKNTSRFIHVNVTIDNATGYTIDEAEVTLHIWKKGKISEAGSFAFTDVRYGKGAGHLFAGTYKADSLSVSFHKIRAKAFNFCYDSEKENQSGNYNDRWFCRDGKPGN